MMNPISRYTRWLHTQWPAGRPEVLPVVADDGSTNVSGLYVVGDLSGVPLLKLSVNAGTRIIGRIADELGGKQAADEKVLDVAIVGGGTAGFAAALEAERRGLRYVVFEASEPFSTIVNFPKGKPIYKYPTDLPMQGDLAFHDKSDVKEGLLEDLREQTVEQGLTWTLGRATQVERKSGHLEVVFGEALEKRDAASLGELDWMHGQTHIQAKRVVVAIGRSGNYRKLGVPGEELDHKVFNRLHDPKDFCGQDVLVVGGGDSAMEAAIALTKCGARVTLSYRKAAFNRPKPENREMLLALSENPEADASIESASDIRQASSLPNMPEGGPKGSLKLLMSTNVKAIREAEVDIEDEQGQVTNIANDAVLAMIGREPPLNFFRRSGVNILGEKNFTWWWTLIAFMLACFWLYHWKGGYPLFSVKGWELPAWLTIYPGEWIPALQARLGEWSTRKANPVGLLLSAAQSRSFYYTLAYSVVVVVFGIRRVRRRKTPYVKWQTATLATIQVVPLFILPEFLLPWLNAMGAFESGAGAWVERTFFPGETWWRAYGLILAWPLMAWNWFTAEPIWGWLILGFLQTFVLIPWMIYYWGKGAYCGWICSCGALAETLGDTQRHKMPHGPGWNRLNMAGQVILLAALGLMGLKIAAWSGVAWAGTAFEAAARGVPFVNYAWFVDLLLAGVVGYGLYFWFSGRVWCRFFCPLAALMHIYARFSRFRILADKKKCISCNVCTTVCHQGIDIMSFANKGEPMADPQCVRCSACVQSCPTGVLTFGQVDRQGNEISRDPLWLASSPVRLAEHQVTVNGRKQV